LIRTLSIGLLAMSLAMSVGCAELSNLDLSSVFSIGRPLDQRTVADGLRQALQIGTQRTTESLAAPGGFARNLRLRISLPSEMKNLARGLRKVGLGARVDAFEDSMNHAAEKATAQAAPILASAISSMSIGDAFAILNGPDDAATTYFRDRTSEQLNVAFSPIIDSAMVEVGLMRAYRDIVAQFDEIPFSILPSVDLGAYLSEQTQAALFLELALEEARIREDPAARSTALLRRVFGSISKDQPSH